MPASIWLTRQKVGLFSFESGTKRWVLMASEESVPGTPDVCSVLHNAGMLALETLSFVRIELDHLFVCTDRGAPEAGQLLQFGLCEGPPNEHPGQGTANRRFAFVNAMIELLWVANRDDAQSQATARTMLWERWSGRRAKACPFGICVRPAESQELTRPFAGWEYRPAYLPSPLYIYIGEAGLEEPMWVYLNFMQRTQRKQWFREHASGVREITALTLHSPAPIRSTVSKVLVEAGIVQIVTGPGYLLVVEFDHNRQKRQVDFRPELPVMFLV